MCFVGIDGVDKKLMEDNVVAREINNAESFEEAKFNQSIIITDLDDKITVATHC
jgi:hypothetical protein